MILKKYCILILAFLIACNGQKNSFTPQKGKDFDNKLKAVDISFFGGFTYNLFGGKSNYILLFNNRSLVRVYSGRKISGDSYKVLHLDESMSMICREVLGPRYLSGDTIIFYKDECFRKMVQYDPLPGKIQGKWAGMTEFRYYHFKANQCDISQRSYYMADSIAALRSLLDYSRLKTLPGDTTYTLEKYPDKESAKFGFFRRYIR